MKAVEAGVAGIIVSNHGARQLDYSPATISALEEVTRSFTAISNLICRYYVRDLCWLVEWSVKTFEDCKRDSKLIIWLEKCHTQSNLVDMNKI